MSLTTGRGPLAADPSGWFSAPVPAGLVFIEPHPRRIQAFRAGQAIIDTEAALAVHRAGSPLSYAFPASIIEGTSLEGTPVDEATGYVTVPWNSVDEWWEEGRRLVHYPPNPYHRVDIRPTQRELRVTVGDTVLVNTEDTVILFETALPPRLYVAPSAVRTDLLRRSETTTYCNYKGWATYWSAVIGDTVVEDVAWSYDEPLDESAGIRGLLSFDADKAVVLADVPAFDFDGIDCGCAVPESTQ